MLRETAEVVLIVGGNYVLLLLTADAFDKEWVALAGLAMWCSAVKLVSHMWFTT